MLRFVDTSEELSYLDRVSIPYLITGIQYATNNLPLDFQYESSEAVTSFVAKKINHNSKQVISETNLSTSLVTLDAGRHICTGQSTLSSNLDDNVYVFVVNNKYESEPFIVTSDIMINYLELEDSTFVELEDGSFVTLEN